MGLLQEIISNLGNFQRNESGLGVVAGEDLVGSNQAKQSGGVVVPSLQNNPSIPIPQGSKTTVAVITADPIIRTNITSKQKLNQTSSKPQIRTTFSNTKSGEIGELSNLKRDIPANVTTEKPPKLSKNDLTAQEREDLVKLTARFKRKTPAQQKVSASPLEIIGIKRAEEVKAKGVFNSKSVANPNFDLGLPSDATQSDRQLAIRQSQAQQGVKLKIEQNKILNQQREKTGQQLLSTIAKSGLNQKQFLRESGVNLNTGNLNAKALARLRERGLI
ncbi:hypothetical protein ES702_02795 [subsurface metagenome]